MEISICTDQAREYAEDFVSVGWTAEGHHLVTALPQRLGRHGDRSLAGVYRFEETIRFLVVVVVVIVVIVVLVIVVVVVIMSLLYRQSSFESQQTRFKNNNKVNTHTANIHTYVKHVCMYARSFSHVRMHACTWYGSASHTQCILIM